MLTQTELITAKLTAEGILNESDIIKYIVENDINSERKRKMLEGERYYDCKEILQALNCLKPMKKQAKKKVCCFVT